MKAIVISLFTIIAALIILIFSRIGKKEKNPQQTIIINNNVLSNFKPLNKPFALESKKKLIVLFSPGCEFCYDEFIDLKRSIDKFQNDQIIFITSADSIDAVRFVNQFHFANNSYSLLNGKNNELHTIFPNYTVPSNYLFHDNNTFIKVFRGRTDIKEILRSLDAKN